MLSRLTDVQERNIEQGVVDILFTRRATAAAKSRPEGQTLTLLDPVRALGQANQRVLGELIELSSSVAKESLRTYAELGRNSFAWYRTSLLHAADASRRAVKFLEANAQIIAAASSLPGFCIRE